MKYILLMQFAQSTADFPAITTWQPEEIQAHIGFMMDTNRKLAESGELVEANGLAMPDTARIVRAGAGGGPAVVTEGPFAETKEFLAGWWIVDVEDEARAVELAAQVSAAPGPGGAPLNMPIEVRQVMSAPTEDV
ncbi:YciI family protein [Yinghuangia soli]|uniref:YciI family protein n=1 Tax=Yinghuangia soli TaxID=2908204 RepID=A0AA41PX53_9ACTN|nr:YciI family protein [Yinghuangia soli]MCF2526152.1 YciI family protein [Yinghuangia soli]